MKASIPSSPLRKEPKQDLHRGSTNRQVFTHLHSNKLRELSEQVLENLS